MNEDEEEVCAGVVYRTTLRREYRPNTLDVHDHGKERQENTSRPVFVTAIEDYEVPSDGHPSSTNDFFSLSDDSPNDCTSSFAMDTKSEMRRCNRILQVGGEGHREGSDDSERTISGEDSVIMNDDIARAARTIALVMQLAKGATEGKLLRRVEAPNLPALLLKTTTGKGGSVQESSTGGERGVLKLHAPVGQVVQDSGRAAGRGSKQPPQPRIRRGGSSSARTVPPIQNFGGQA